MPTRRSSGRTRASSCCADATSARASGRPERRQHDARPAFATRKRFLEADDLAVEWPHRYLVQTMVDDRTVICVLTLEPGRFREITRRDRLDDVLAGLVAARDAGLRPVKVNAVLLRGINDDEAADLLSFCLDNGCELRFIEQMPLDAGHTWRRDQVVTAEEILSRLGQRFTLTPVDAPRGNAPAERWVVDGGPATVGVIASVTRPFCGTCDRTRLTADGQIRSCLFSTTETDLRALLRSGARDEEVAAAWRLAMWGKPAAHGSDEFGFAEASRPMSAIGG